VCAPRLLSDRPLTGTERRLYFALCQPQRRRWEGKGRWPRPARRTASPRWGVALICDGRELDPGSNFVSVALDLAFALKVLEFLATTSQSRANERDGNRDAASIHDGDKLAAPQFPSAKCYCRDLLNRGIAWRCMLYLARRRSRQCRVDETHRKRCEDRGLHPPYKWLTSARVRFGAPNGGIEHVPLQQLSDRTAARTMAWHEPASTTDELAESGHGPGQRHFRSRGT
jgi:hypothetical protein